MNPLDTQREATISFMTNTGETNDVSLPLSYYSDSGNFRGDLNDYLLPKGSYILRIKVPGFLVKQIPGFITVQNTSLITPQSAYLTTGDIIANNALDILDYNSILDCYEALGPASNCEDPAKQKASDITNDGIVDQLDYNLFLRELSVQSGQ